MKALEVTGLCKNFGGLSVLQGVSFSVHTGERKAIIGPNGAGKTTLFNIISGMIKPTAGEIFMFGKNVTGLSPYRRSRLGLARTFQKNNLFFNLTVFDNIQLALAVGNPLQNPREFLKHWGLWKKRKTPVGELSYGEQRQVELLLALAQSPRLILLDEPTAGMSPAETEMIIEMLAALPQEITVLIVEHDMGVVFRLADRITVLHHGRVLCEGDADLIKSDPRVKEAYLGTAGEEVDTNAAAPRSSHILRP